jgi:hypothetical protein
MTPLWHAPLAAMVTTRLLAVRVAEGRDRRASAALLMLQSPLPNAELLMHGRGTTGRGCCEVNGAVRVGSLICTAMVPAAQTPTTAM